MYTSTFRLLRSGLPQSGYVMSLLR